MGVGAGGGEVASPGVGDDGGSGGGGGDGGVVWYVGTAVLADAVLCWEA